jgi:hypothetical protein
VFTSAQAWNNSNSMDQQQQHGTAATPGNRSGFHVGWPADVVLRAKLNRQFHKKLVPTAFTTQSTSGDASRASAIPYQPKSPQHSTSTQTPLGHPKPSSFARLVQLTCTPPPPKTHTHTLRGPNTVLSWWVAWMHLRHQQLTTNTGQHQEPLSAK